MIDIERYFRRWKLDPASLAWWVLATTAGWGLIPFLVSLLLRPAYEAPMAWILGGQPSAYSSDVSYAYGAVSVTLLGVLFGVTFGFLEWLVLRKHIPRAGQWFVATYLGLSLGGPLSGIALRPLFDNPLLSGAVSLVVSASWVAPGLSAGFLQRLVLKKYFARTWWWLLPSALTWPVAPFYLYEHVWHMDVRAAGFYSIMGFVFGVISGLALLLISKRLRMESGKGKVEAGFGPFPPGVMQFPGA